MNAYKAEMENGERDRMKASMAAVLRGVCEQGMLPYICALSEIPAERLTKIADGEEPTLAEMLAVTEAIRLAAASVAEPSLAALQKQAADAMADWGVRVSGAVHTSLETIKEPVAETGFGSAAAFLGKFHVFLDAAALSSPRMAVFLDRMLPLLQTEKERIHTFSVPETVVRYLNEHAVSTHEEESKAALGGIRQLKRLQEAGLLTVRGDDGDTTMRSTFVSAFARFKPKYRLLLLTADEKLAKAVFYLNLSGLEGEDVLVARLREDGSMALWPMGEAMAAPVPMERSTEDVPSPDHTPSRKAQAKAEETKKPAGQVQSKEPKPAAGETESAAFRGLLAELLALYGIREPAPKKKPEMESVNIEKLLIKPEKTDTSCAGGYTLERDAAEKQGEEGAQ